MGKRPSNIPGQNTERLDRALLIFALVSGGLLLAAMIGAFSLLLYMEYLK